MGVRRTADAEWRLSLRESGGSRLKRTPRLPGDQRLGALDLSFNMFSDATSRQLCDVLRLGAHLEALNLQGNQLRRRSAQMYLLVFKTWGVPRLVDLRKNLEGKDVGVLEDGRHLHSFSRRHAPFWNASLFGFSLENNLPGQERKPSLQKQNPGLSCNPLPRPLHVIDPAISSNLTSEPLLTKNMSSTAEECTTEHQDHGARVDSSSPFNLLVQGDSSPQKSESTATKECLPGPQADHQREGQVSNIPLGPFLCLEDGVHQISSFRGNNEEDQMSTSPILDLPKDYPHLLESENSRSGDDGLHCHHSPLHPNDQTSDQLRRQTKTGEGPSRPLSHATPEFTSRKYRKRDSNVEEKNSKLPNRTFAEFTLRCQRVQKSVDDVNLDSAPTLDTMQGPTLDSKCQPGEQKMRKSTQHSRQSTSKEYKTADKKPSMETTDPKLVPGQDLRYRQNKRKTATCQNQKKTQTKLLQHRSVYSTSEWQKEESEWSFFMWDMARSLLHIQEGLDILMEPSKPDAESADKVAVTELHKYLQQPILSFKT